MTSSFIFPPGLILVLCGFLLPLFARVGLRSVVLLVAPLVTLYCVWALPDGAQLSGSYLGYHLVYLQMDSLSRVFALVFAIMAFAGGLFSLNQKSTIELAAAYVYAGSAIGVATAGDLITVFVFWEMMAVASTVIVWCGGEGGRVAGMRYGIIHMLGGVLLMAGIAGEIAATGSTAFGSMDISTVPRMLMLAGVLVDAAAIG